MILSYDSILGIPTVESSGESNNTSSTNSSLNLGVPAVLLLIVIIVVFMILFSSLGKQESVSPVNGSDGSSKLLSILMGGVLIVVVLLNGLQYFFNINYFVNFS